MSRMSDYDLLLQEVSGCMDECEPGSPQQTTEYRISCLIRELDDLCAMAKNNPHHFDQHMIQVGQVVSRAELFAGFILGRAYPTHRLVGRA